MFSLDLLYISTKYVSLKYIIFDFLSRTLLHLSISDFYLDLSFSCWQLLALALIESSLLNRSAFVSIVDLCHMHSTCSHVR